MYANAREPTPASRSLARQPASEGNDNNRKAMARQSSYIVASLDRVKFVY